MNSEYKNKDWLKEQYQDNHLTQREIAAMCGVTETTIQSWVKVHNLHLENGNRKPAEYIKYKCSQCGKENEMPKAVYLHRSSKNHFCSKECHSKYRTAHKKEYKRDYPPKSEDHMYICKYCNISFWARKPANYCCADHYHKATITREKIICTECGKEFELTKSEIKWQKKRGVKHFFCSTDCSKKYLRGENCSNYIQDRSKLKNPNHSLRWSADMIEWRKAVYSRDGYTCQVCGLQFLEKEHNGLHPHHIIPLSKSKELAFDVNNGIALCEKCHRKTMGHEQDFEEQFQKIVKQKEVVNAAV